MEVEKIKFMCVVENAYGCFKKGKIYEGYATDNSRLVDDDGYVYDRIPVNELIYTSFIPLSNIAFVIRCTDTIDDRFKFGELYFVLRNGSIYDDDRFDMRDFESYTDWYYKCNWIDYSFELVKDYTSWLNISEKQEENKVNNLEKLGLVKGIEEESIKNVFKATTDKRGRITLQPIKMINLCFVRHFENEKIYVFENPSDKRLASGTRVRVDTKHGEKDAVVVSSIKLQRKYLKNFMLAFTGDGSSELKKVLGVYETVTKEELHKFD